MKHVVSFSGGKDSTCMLLKLVEQGTPLDAVVFSDTTVEWPEMYEHVDKVEKDLGIKITRLRPPHDFEYYLLYADRKRSWNKGILKGYAFPHPMTRWCTSLLKRGLIENWIKATYPGETVTQYIGIAANEAERAQALKTYGIPRFPLIELNITSKGALEYCYSKGYGWGGLYKKFSRVSCWCCPMQSLSELKMLHDDYPELWAKIKEWESKTYNNFRMDYSLRGLELLFKAPNAQFAKGRSNEH